MIPYKEILGTIGVVLGFFGYMPYLRDMYRGTTKPHFFSWFIWGLLGGIAFLAQIVAHAGAGAWTTGCMTVMCFGIAGFALFRGEKDVTPLDWVCFAGALLGILFWMVTKDPLAAIVIITTVDLVAFVPTFRKSYDKPREETLSQYVIASLKYVFAIAALQALTLTTWLYPVSLVLTNAIFAIMIYVRRSQLSMTP